MPLKFSEIVNRTKKIEVEIGEDRLSLEFKTEFYTPAVASKISTSTSAIAAQVEVMADAIVSWDLLGDDGEPMPITVETLSAIGLGIINTIYQAMVEAVLPNVTKAGS